MRSIQALCNENQSQDGAVVVLKDWIWQDIRHGCRALWRAPGFTTVVLMTMAIGIGASTAVFSFFDAVILKPLPYASADRIVRVLATNPSGATSWVSTLDYLDWRSESTVFEHLAAQQRGLVTLGGLDEPIALQVSRVSANFFDVFGVKAFLGRTFVTEEDLPGHERVAVLGYGLWNGRFAGDQQIVGKKIVLDDKPYTVVGVLAEDEPLSRSNAQIWYPLALKRLGANRDYRWLNQIFGQLRPGISLAQARAEMGTIAGSLAVAYPDSNRGWGVAVDRYADVLVGVPLRTSLLALMSAVGGVLLICCVNLANLVLARSLLRDGEVAVRATLGATRTRIARQFFCENLLLAFGGSLLGLVLGAASVAWFRASVPAGTLPSEASVELDARVLAFAIAVAMLTSVLFGLAPVMRARASSFVATIRSTQRGSTAGQGPRRVLRVLVVAEVILAVVLLYCSTLLVRSFIELANIDTGFSAGDALTMSLPIEGFPPGSGYSDPEEFKAYVREIMAAVGAIPGVRGVAMTSALPLTDCCLYTLRVQVEGRPAPDRASPGGGFFKVVTPSYFSTLGLTLASGRFIDDRDTSTTRRIVVINERLAYRYFPGENPIGHRILSPEIIPGKTERGADVAWEIVGVVEDERATSLQGDTSAVAYASYEQSPVYFANLVVSADLDAALLQPQVRDVLHDINASQSVRNALTLDQIKSNSIGSNRFRTTLLSAFALIALVLAAVGIFGVLAYSVIQRTREIGIRAAIGATRSNLLLMVLREGTTLSVIGLAVGLILGYALSPLLNPILYGVASHDPHLMLAVSVVFLLGALAACLAPAARAARLDPITVLRSE